MTGVDRVGLSVDVLERIKRRSPMSWTELYDYVKVYEVSSKELDEIMSILARDGYVSYVYNYPSRLPKGWKVVDGSL